MKARKRSGSLGNPEQLTRRDPLKKGQTKLPEGPRIGCERCNFRYLSLLKMVLPGGVSERILPDLHREEAISGFTKGMYQHGNRGLVSNWQKLGYST